MLAITAELLTEADATSKLDWSLLIQKLIERFKVSEDCLRRILSDEKIAQWLEDIEKSFN